MGRRHCRDFISAVIPPLLPRTEHLHKQKTASGAVGPAMIQRLRHKFASQALCQPALFVHPGQITQLPYPERLQPMMTRVIWILA